MALRIATLEDIGEAATQVERAPVVAVDTEFHAERRYAPRLYLVQVRPPSGDSWLIDPLVPGLVEAVAPALSITPWIVHGGSKDLSILLRVLGRLPPIAWDTQIAAGLVSNEYPARFDHLTRAWLGASVDKAETLTDWSQRPLTAAQAAYAARDVDLLPPLWDALWVRAGELGRQPLLQLACEAAMRRVADPPPPDTTWRAIQAVATLTRQQAAVLQELAGWRETRAREANQPPYSIASDAILVGLARTQPATHRELANNRRMPRALTQRHATELIELIQRAARRPEWAWPRFPTPGTPEARRVAWLTCFVECDAAAASYAPRLGLPLDLRQDIAVRPPRDPRELASAIGAWRAELLGSRLWDAIDGRLGLWMATDDIQVRRVAAAAMQPDPPPGARGPTE